MLDPSRRPNPGTNSGHWYWWGGGSLTVGVTFLTIASARAGVGGNPWAQWAAIVAYVAIAVGVACGIAGALGCRFPLAAERWLDEAADLLERHQDGDAESESLVVANASVSAAPERLIGHRFASTALCLLRRRPVAIGAGIIVFVAGTSAIVALPFLAHSPAGREDADTVPVAASRAACSRTWLKALLRDEWAAYDGLVSALYVRRQAGRYWKMRISPSVGERLDFVLVMRNNSSQTETGVEADIDWLGLKYIAGSTVLRSPSHPDGTALSDPPGLPGVVRLGDYAMYEGARLCFSAQFRAGPGRIVIEVSSDTTSPERLVMLMTPRR